MKVKLNFLNSLSDLAKKFRFASDTLDKIDSLIDDGKNILGEQDKRIIYDNLVNTENPHKHLRKTIDIDYEIYGITRALLQEFVRHPIGNAFVVTSTRYSLHRIAKDERIDIKYFRAGCDYEDLSYLQKIRIIKDYYYVPINDFIDFKTEAKNIYVSSEYECWINSRYYELQCIKYYKLKCNMKNDQLKKYINEYMLCNVTGKMSGECLWNLLKQRLDSVAWYQFQELAKEIYIQIPEEWKPLFKVYKYKKVLVDDFIKKYLNREIEIHAHEMSRFEELIKKLISKDLVEKEYLI
jgi:thymidylate synthase ThyX